MTRLIEGRYRDADKCYSWAQAAEEHEPIRNLFPSHGDRFIQLNAKFRLSDEAWRQLCAMNDFDRGKVAEELLQIVASPTDPLHSDASRRNVLQRLRRVRYPFKSYHYAIAYALGPDGAVLADRFWFDKRLVGAKPGREHQERNLLYVVNRTGMPGFREISGSSGRIAKR